MTIIILALGHDNVMTSLLRVSRRVQNLIFALVQISDIALRFQKYGRHVLLISQSDCRYFHT